MQSAQIALSGLATKDYWGPTCSPLCWSIFLADSLNGVFALCSKYKRHLTVFDPLVLLITVKVFSVHLTTTTIVLFIHTVLAGPRECHSHLLVAFIHVLSDSVRFTLTITCWILLHCVSVPPHCMMVSHYVPLWFCRFFNWLTMCNKHHTPLNKSIKNQFT